MIPFSQTNPPATLAEINQVEQELGFTFPLSYRDFLLQYNGGVPQKAFFRRPIINGSAVQATSVNKFDTLKDALECWHNLAPSSDEFYEHFEFTDGTLFPIGEDIGGYAICIGVTGTANGKIYIVDNGDFGVTFQSNTLDEFLESLEDDPDPDID